MRINKLTVKNYRTLEDVTVNFKSNYCTISGHNNAGKSSIIRLISNLIQERERRPWYSDTAFSYTEDKTQWLHDGSNIVVTYDLHLDHDADSALISYIERISKTTYSTNPICLTITIEVDLKSTRSSRLSIDGLDIEEIVAKDIIDRIKSSKNMFLYNSARNELDYYYRGGRMTVMYDVLLSSEDHASIAEAESRLQKQVKRVAKAHKSELDAMLGRLSDKYDVEFSTIDSTSTPHFPFTINLTDRHVEVPLPDWGSGTQNRTHILMSILQANRMRTGKKGDERITPFVVIEEPESFLHPSAQAEFGAILQALSDELHIQIIVSTHSPFMLNQVDPSSNILLKRKLFRNKFLCTEIVNTEGDNWMAPYAEHLGIIPPEFDGWRSLFSNTGSKVLLVEGEIDKEYMEYLRTNYSEKFPLPLDVDIVSFGGKGALNNTAMVKFMISKIGDVFVTFDLDAAVEAKKSLERVGLKEGDDFLAIGQNKPGRDAIEGLLPERVLSTVHGRETDLIMALASNNSEIRKSARSRLKRFLLDEFKKHKDYDDTEMRLLSLLGKAISKRFHTKGTR